MTPGQIETILGLISKSLTTVLLDRFIPGIPVFREISFEIGSIAKRSELLLAPSLSVIAREAPIENLLSKSVAESETYEGIRAHMLENATVFYNRRFSPLLVGRNCVAAARKEPGPWDFGVGRPGREPGSVLFQNGMTIGFRGGGPSRRLDEVLYVGTRAPDNYYHWLINALPSLHLANQSTLVPGSAPVLVPEILRTRSQLVEALEVVANNRPIEYFGMSESIRAKRLFMVDPPPIYDTPLSRNQKDRRPLTFHNLAMASFRDKILQAVDPKPQELARERLFLLRPTGDNRGVNQEELFRVAEDFGFIGVRAEMLSFMEQVELFSTAKFITGPSGAAFTNILFSSKAKSLIYKASLNQNENFFALLASIGGGSVLSLAYEADERGVSGNLSPVRYRKALETMLQKD